MFINALSKIKGRTMYQEYQIKGQSYHLFDEGPGVPYGLYREDAEDFVLLAKVAGDVAPPLEQIEAYVLHGCPLLTAQSNPARLH